MSLEPSDSCNRIDRELLIFKREELSSYIKNYKQILKFIDTVLPMMENMEAFVQNEVSLDAFVRRIYDEIKKSGAHLEL
jgi:hypothetical protein